MGIQGIILNFVIGIFLLQVSFTSLLSFNEKSILLCIAVICIVILFVKSRFKILRNSPVLYYRLLSIASLGIIAVISGIFYADWNASIRLTELKPQSYNEWQNKLVEIEGIVSNVPITDERGTRFELDILNVLTPNIHLPQRISVGLYPEQKQNYHFKNTKSSKNNDTENLEKNLENDENNLNSNKFHAGQRWKLTLKAKKPYGLSNPSTFNTELWMFQRNIGANGTIQYKKPMQLLEENVCDQINKNYCQISYYIEQKRENVRDYLQAILKDQAYTGVIIALTIGDQRLIPKEQWTTFFKTGINHLVSISGLHVTMVAGIFAHSIMFLWRRSSRLLTILPAKKVFAIVGFLSAFGYSLLAGFAVPTQRTLYMLGTIAVALLLNRTISAYTILSWALLVVVLIDPWSVLSIGFWLSFGAVGILMYVSVYRIGRQDKLEEGANVQWAVTIGLIPILLVVFQQISLISPIANIIAVPVVSFLITPLSLLGAIPIDILKYSAILAHEMLRYLMIYLDFIANLPQAIWSQHTPPLWVAIIGTFGILLALAPKGFPAKSMSIFLFGGLVFISPNRPQNGDVWIKVLDVGNGFAIVIQTENYNLLYDAGVKFNTYDIGERVVIPVLRGLGINQLNHVFISHDDSDHSGGLISIAKAVPIQLMTSTLPAGHEAYQYIKNTELCLQGQTWIYDQVKFEVLYPQLDDFNRNYLKDNDLSCVLKITAGSQSILLAGDIEKTAESILIDRLASTNQLKSTVLLAPHHGSKTSSTQTFLETVQPQYGIFSVGYLNRYRHPHPSIVKRYNELGIKIFRTDYQGMLEIQLNANNSMPLIQGYRDKNKHYWND